MSQKSRKVLLWVLAGAAVFGVVVLLGLTLQDLVGAFAAVVAGITGGWAARKRDAARNKVVEDLEDAGERVDEALNRVDELDDQAARERAAARDELDNLSPEDKARLGDELLVESPPRPRGPQFGRRLTAENVVAHLEAVRRDNREDV
jgi:hypothetical protein